MDSKVNPFAMNSQAEWHTDWTMGEYLAHPALSRSDLWTIHTEGLYGYKWAKDRGGKDETDAMRLGTAIHLAVLEPESFETLVTVYTKRRSGKEWEEFQAQNDRAGITILTQAQYETAVAIRDYVRSMPAIRRLFSKGVVESSMVWMDTDSGVQLKSRPDFLDLEKGWVLDLKSTNDLGEYSMKKKVESFGYHMQGAMSLDGSAACVEWPRFSDVYLLFVRTIGAPRCALRRIPEHMLEEGREAYKKAAQAYAKAQSTGVWTPPEVTMQDLWSEERL